MYFANSECKRDLSQCSHSIITMLQVHKNVRINTFNCVSIIINTLSTPLPSLNEWIWARIIAGIEMFSLKSIVSCLLFFLLFLSSFIASTESTDVNVCLWNFILQIQRLFRCEITSAYERRLVSWLLQIQSSTTMDICVCTYACVFLSFSLYLPFTQANTRLCYYFQSKSGELAQKQFYQQLLNHSFNEKA